MDVIKRRMINFSFFISYSINHWVQIENITRIGIKGQWDLI